MFDPQLFRHFFPLLNTGDNRELIYLDNAATAQTLQVVIDRIQRFYTYSNGNANRSSHRLSHEASQIVEATRKSAAAFMGCEASEVIFTYGATDALNGLARSLTDGLGVGEEILISEGEHHANFVPWQQFAKEKSLELRCVPLTSSGIDIDALLAMVSNKTQVLSFSIGLNSFGCYPDMEELNQRLKGLKARYPQLTIIFDATQYAVHKPLACASWACDFLVCSAHKLYGPTGVGLLYGDVNALAALKPWRWGGDMVQSVTLERTELLPSPDCFESGTLPLASIAGLQACLEWWQSINRHELEAHETSLTSLLHELLKALVASEPELQLLSEEKNNLGLGVLAVNAGASFSVFDIAQWLDEHNIAVRAGKLCAQPALAARGVDAVLRLSIAGYTTRADIEKTVHSIKAFLNETTVASLPNGCVDKLDSLDWDALISPQPWQSRYKQLMSWAEAITPKPEICIPENQVSGCQTDVWLTCDRVGEKCYFSVYSPSRLLRGFAAIVLYHLQGKSASQILRFPIHQTLQPIGLEKQLSASRNNGFHALLSAMLECVESQMSEMA